MAELRVRFHASAIEDAEAAQRWYKERSEIASLAFVDELSHAVKKVAETPERWPTYEKKTRRYIFPRYPFSLIYRISQDVVEVIVIAIAHHRKKLGYWVKKTQ